MSRQRSVVAVMSVVLGLSGSAVLARAQMQHAGGAHEMKATGRATPPRPIRTTMASLHAHGGVPPGWKFLMPPGDAVEGRKTFAAMECFACHEVHGEDFPRETKTPRGAGPELTGMGSHHPAEYFAESIVNPNRVIVEGPGYTGPDGLSKMPSYGDTMTVKQLADVVAYLKTLTGGEMTHGAHKAPGPPMQMPAPKTVKPR